MKLLSKNEAGHKLQLEKDELVETNIRLREYWQSINDRLNNLKDDYEPDKLQKLKEFEEFCKKLQVKRTKLLEELSILQRGIEQKKELFYGLIEKQDRLEERLLQANEAEAKLKLRETFVVDLEQKWRMKQDA